MSDVSKTNELIEKLALAAEDAAGGPPSAEQVDALIEYADALRDALEAATDGDYHEGIEEGIKIGRAERDAAIAAVERIREAVSGHPECDRYSEDDVISCGWKSAYASVVAALDGAPEPEEKP